MVDVPDAKIQANNIITLYVKWLSDKFSELSQLFLIKFEQMALLWGKVIENFSH